MRTQINYVVSLGVMFLGLAACGGGGSGSASTGQGNTSNVSNVAGIWYGSIQFDGQPAIAYPDDIFRGAIAENGDGGFVDNQGSAYVITGISGTNGNITITFDVIAGIDVRFSDGGFRSSGTITGVVTEHDTIDGTWQLVTGETGTLALDFDDSYFNPSSIESVASVDWVRNRLVRNGFSIVGNGDNTEIFVDPDGSFAMNLSAQCHSYTGNLSVIDSRFNLYAVEFYFDSCGPGFDGKFVGLGTYWTDGEFQILAHAGGAYNMHELNWYDDVL